MHATGPRTEEGKSRSRYNAYKHGLTGQTLVIHPDQRAAYESHCRAYFDLYRPTGHAETILVQNIADDYWRSVRARAIESCHVDITPLDDPQFIRGLCNLALYMQRIERSIKNNTQALAEMQLARREAEREIPPAESVKPAPRTAAASPEFVFSHTPPDPQSTPDFVASNPESAPSGPLPNLTLDAKAA